MSGRKRSEWLLEKQREEKLGLLAGIATTSNSIAGIGVEVRQTLDKTPRGIKKTFTDETGKADRWLQDVGNFKVGKLNFNTDLPVLNDTLAQLKSQLARGNGVLESLITSTGQKASALEKQLASRLAKLDSSLIGHKETLATWFGSAFIAEHEKAVGQARSLLDKQELGEVEKYLAKTEGVVTAQIAEAGELEDKRQKRDYVLTGLRQVCWDMGLQELDLREAESPRAPIVFEVQTHLGKIRFFLSLDTISTESGIAEDKCLGEFDKLSQQLRDKFGVKTRFRPEGEKTDGKLLQKGELEEPDGGALEKAV